MKTRIKALAYVSVFTALCGFLFYTSISDLYNSLRIAFNGVTAEGRVITVDRVVKHSQQDNYYTVIQFTDHRGEIRRFKNRHPYSYLFVPEVGDPVKVRYLRNDTRVAMPATVWESILGPLLSLLIGVFFGWAAIEEYKTLLTGKGL